MLHFRFSVTELTCIFKSKLYFRAKFRKYFSTSNTKLTVKSKFTMTNSFTFENEFKQYLDHNNVSNNQRIVSADLLSNQDQAIRQQNKSVPNRKKNKPSFKYRGEILYGIHPVYMALLQKKRVFYNLYIRKFSSSDNSFNIEKKEEIANLSKSMDIPISYIGSKELKILTSDGVHQGICLDAGFLPVSVWDDQTDYQNANERPLWLVLNEILDPMNVGAIIRSAYYFGVNKLFVVLGNSCSKLSPTVSKASSGSLEVMDICWIENLEQFIKNRKENGWCIVSTAAYLENKQESSKLTTSATELNTTKPTILILGNEGRGIPQTIQSMCDTLISVEPGRTLHQGIDSLNVSVATGVLLYVLNSVKNRRNV